ncbi:MAG: NfeD family protein [Oscillibacter sp.]|nr:NfeD family protein [Oscillibacter sp.]
MIWIWLLVMAAFAAAEAATVGLVCIWFSVGALGAFFTALAGGSVTVQLVVFAAVSAAALAVTRPLVRRFGRNRRVPTNLDRVIGRTGQVTEDIDTASGAVYVDGKTWTARSAGGEAIPAGTQVEILSMEGVKLFVKKLEKDTEVVS